MMRHCDGRDPRLIGEDGKPCRCMSTFDDVHRVTVYPHAAIWTQEMKARLIDSVANTLGVPAADDPSWWRGQSDERMDVVREAIERARETT